MGVDAWRPRRLPSPRPTNSSCGAGVLIGYGMEGSVVVSLWS